MTRVTVKTEVVAQLNGLQEPLEFCDEAGNVLGHFEPDENSPVIRAWLRTLDHGLLPEEVERRISDRSGITTAELLKRLRGENQ